MGRVYSMSMNDVSVSATQDLFNLTATANMAFRLLRIEGGQRSLTSWEAKPVRLRRQLATVTAGSGGSAGTVRKLNNGDAAATVTGRINDTTQQTGTSTEELFNREFEFLNGFFWVPTPREDFIIAPSQGISLALPTAPSGATSMSWTVIFEELF